MATCRDIVTHALNIGATTKGSPSASELDLGMTCLQSLYDEWVSGGMFGRLKDVFLQENDIAEPGRRYYLNGYTLTFATNENQAQMPDLALVETVSTGGVRTVKLFDRYQWVNLLSLAAADDAPLASRGAMGLAAALACSGAFLAAFGDAEVSPRVERLSNRFIGALMHKLGSTQPAKPVVFY